jgi:hypothetical protein
MKHGFAHILAAFWISAAAAQEMSPQQVAAQRQAQVDSAVQQGLVRQVGALTIANIQAQARFDEASARADADDQKIAILVKQVADLQAKCATPAPAAPAAPPAPETPAPTPSPPPAPEAAPGPPKGP